MDRPTFFRATAPCDRLAQAVRHVNVIRMRVAAIIAAACLGVVAGAATALYAAGMLGKAPRLGAGIEVDGWSSDWSIGSEAANPWVRARVARHGLLALRKEEAVYFTRARDDDGAALSETCHYRVSGTDLPGDWWSITLYDGRSYLPRNDDRALSFDQTRAAAAGHADDWFFIVSPTQPQTGEAWVSSRNAGQFDLTLRIYRPRASFLADPEAQMRAPRVERLDCGTAS